MGTWIEIDAASVAPAYLFRRSLRGNVDRNVALVFSPSAPTSVVPYVGTWIEIYLVCPATITPSVVPYVGTWIEMQSQRRCDACAVVVTYVGTWIEIHDSFPHTT